MKKKLQIEVGKYYRNRAGEVIRITDKVYWCPSPLPFVGDDNRAYSKDGRFSLFNESKFDLVYEVTDPILQFFTPSRMELLSISAIETAAGIPPRTLYKFLKGTRGLPKKHREPLIEVLKKVGYDG